MNQIVYLNGAYVPRHEAKLDIEDRGTLFGDGVYEVVHYFNGRPFAMQEHVDRLARSLDAIAIKDATRFDQVSDELIQRNSLTDAKVYWQVTRGAARRDHVYPDHLTPTTLAIAEPTGPLPRIEPPAANKAVFVPDQRWDLCCIKSLMLLPNVLAKAHARQKGADEAILHRDGRVTEGASTNAFIIIGGELWTHPADPHILGGITRDIVLHLAQALNIPCHEQAVSIDQARAADEMFITGTTTLIAGITHVDDQPIAGGTVGPVTTQLHRALIDHVAADCGL